MGDESKIGAERWKRVEEIFAAVVELPPEQHGAMLDEVCSADDDPELRSLIMELLEADRKADEFLESPVIVGNKEEILQDLAAGLQRAAGRSSPSHGSTQPTVDALPEQIGPYCVEGTIGFGGMGLVLKAWDERLQRSVAIKSIHPGKSLSVERRERLLREARAIAALTHPCIAQAFDSGFAYLHTGAPTLIGRQQCVPDTSREAASWVYR